MEPVSLLPSTWYGKANWAKKCGASGYGETDRIQERRGKRPQIVEMDLDSECLKLKRHREENMRQIMRAVKTVR